LHSGALWIGYFIFRTYASQLEPPRIQSVYSIPIQVGDKTVMLGVGVLEWKVPDELNAIMVEEDMLKKEAAEKAAKEAALKQEEETKTRRMRRALAQIKIAGL